MNILLWAGCYLVIALVYWGMWMADENPQDPNFSHTARKMLLVGLLWPAVILASIGIALGKKK